MSQQVLTASGSEGDTHRSMVLDASPREKLWIMKCCAKFVQCKYWHSKQPSDEYEERKRCHHCSINHTGSDGSMEAAGVKSIYSRLVVKKKLRQTTYLGDRDSKSSQDMV